MDTLDDNEPSHIDPEVSDLIDPATEDWASMDDAAVYHAARAGVPQAVREMSLREIAR